MSASGPDRSQVTPAHEQLNWTYTRFYAPPFTGLPGVQTSEKLKIAMVYFFKVIAFIKLKGSIWHLCEIKQIITL